MRSFHMTFIIDDDGLLIVDGENNGFTGLELVGALDFKKNDILKQIMEPAKFNRTIVYGDGRKEIFEDKG